MAKKIIVLNGSPRANGNTKELVKAFVKGAESAGNTVQVFDLQKMNIHGCLGCCMGGKDEASPFVQKDDMAEILDKMVQADVIVMATPVYFYSMNGQMKTLIDRTVPRYEEIAGKDFYFIVAAADSNRANMEKTLETFRGFTEDCLPDAHEKGVIYGTGAWQIGDIKSSPAMEEAYQAGRNA